MDKDMKWKHRCEVFRASYEDAEKLLGTTDPTTQSSIAMAKLRTIIRALNGPDFQPGLLEGSVYVPRLLLYKSECTPKHRDVKAIIECDGRQYSVVVVTGQW